LEVWDIYLLPKIRKINNFMLVSVIIVNYNAKKWLDKCITSILSQTHKNIEVILTDNASTDGSVEYVAKKFPKVIIRKSNSNRGYSGGANFGAKYAKGDFFLIVNTDMYLEKDFLEKSLKAFAENSKLAILQSKIVHMNDHNVIDTCGGFWTDTTFLYHYGNSKNASLPIYNKPFPVFTVKAVAVVVRASVVKRIGLFDDDFWCYYEETDFCHRAWLSGYECWYYPSAKVFHEGGATTLTFPNDFVQFHNFKNKTLSFLKNFEESSLVTIIPKFIALNILLSVIWLFQGKWKHSLSLYKAFMWNIQRIPQTRKKRARIQKLRAKRDSEYMKICLKNPRLSYYYHLLTIQFDKYSDL